ncbi:hypothetical protein AKJ09_08973 [Labilithrix luteola]|uniref:Uncharacterized protein n=1 Tax=Labilithrix luteola TaxID=1391654 RepID=A0A0K1QA80_9BACT|nr:hypothetical protein AKJ09_08973 [Labilithrix luteola]
MCVDGPPANVQRPRQRRAGGRRDAFNFRPADGTHAAPLQASRPPPSEKTPSNGIVETHHFRQRTLGRRRGDGSTRKARTPRKERGLCAAPRKGRDVNWSCVGYTIGTVRINSGPAYFVVTRFGPQMTTRHLDTDLRLRTESPSSCTRRRPTAKASPQRRTLRMYPLDDARRLKILSGDSAAIFSTAATEKFFHPVLDFDRCQHRPVVTSDHSDERQRQPE